MRIIDFHCHIFPAKIIKERDRYLSKDPAFRLLYHNPNSRLVTADELISHMDQEGVERSVVFGFPWSEPDIYKFHNDYVIESVNRFPNRLKGFACFLPSDDINSIEREAIRCLDMGLVGIGEIAWYLGDISDIIDNMQGVMEIAKEREAVVLFHTNEPVGHKYPGKTNMTIKGIYRLVERYQENKIVLAHWGGGILFFQLLKKEIKQVFRNVWFDTAASPYLYSNEIYRIALQIVGPSKIVFGSDYPLISPNRYIVEARKAELSEEEMQRLFWRNAIELLKWGA